MTFHVDYIYEAKYIDHRNNHLNKQTAQKSRKKLPYTLFRHIRQLLIFTTRHTQLRIQSMTECSRQRLALAASAVTENATSHATPFVVIHVASSLRRALFGILNIPNCTKNSQRTKGGGHGKDNEMVASPRNKSADSQSSCRTQRR